MLNVELRWAVRALLVQLLLQPCASDRRAIGMPIERTMAPRKGAKDPIKEVETDPKVLVHPSSLIDGVVMNVVEPPGRTEPCAHQGDAFHPEILNVHAVMQVAEHESRPSHERGGSKRPIGERNAQQPHYAPTKRQN